MIGWTLRRYTTEVYGSLSVAEQMLKPSSGEFQINFDRVTLFSPQSATPLLTSCKEGKKSYMVYRIPY